ncbi:MAG: hypothetical protein U0802_15495 [Candidatus Binatia bacterium]
MLVTFSAHTRVDLEPTLFTIADGGSARTSSLVVADRDFNRFVAGRASTWRSTGEARVSSAFLAGGAA